MAFGTFISSLPLRVGGTLPVRVVEADITHAEDWDRDIQIPWIDKMDRIDRFWRWRELYLRSALLERALRRKLAFLQLVTPAADGSAFVLGQMLLANGFPYPPARRQGCVFLWYLAGAPTAAAERAGVPRYQGILNALVDTAVQLSYRRGYSGRVCLHASPEGRPEQRDALMERYKMAGLLPWNEGLFVGWIRRNDGRYFLATEQASAAITLAMDVFR